jgi:hypothetical protein
MCVFFDNLNELPEVGYVKELMMERRMMGTKYENFVIVATSSIGKAKERANEGRLPSSMRQISWDFD